MASQVKVDVSKALKTAAVVGSDAAELRGELARISQKWDGVLAGWSGAAASVFTALWEDWHDGVAKLVETLAESSQRLAEAAVAYDEQEAISTRSVLMIPVEIEL